MSFWYLKWKSSYNIDYIDFTPLFKEHVIRFFKNELVFHFRMLNDICDCDDDIGYVMLLWEKTFLFH